MSFADKLIKLRKKEGLSQEELADKMNVSRQAVSKWESSQSIPDLDKILLLSNMFNVSTDYLLKDNLENEEINEGLKEIRYIKKEEVDGYIKARGNSSIKVGIATMLCILSPMLLCFLSLLTDESVNYIKEKLAVIIGLSTLFLFICIAVGLFIEQGISLSKYDFLEKEEFRIDNNIKEYITNEQENYRTTYSKLNVIATILSILSPVALIISGVFGNVLFLGISLCLLFIIISIAVYLYINAGFKWGSYKRLIKEGNLLSPVEKKLENISTIFWLITTAIYLTISFIWNIWHISWLVWPIASLLYCVMRIILKSKCEEKNV